MPAPRRRLTQPSKGAPSALTDETRERLLKAIGMGVPISVAAEVAGIGERTYQRWRLRGLEVQDRVQEAEAKGETIELDPDREEPYLEFITALREAQAQAITHGVLTLQRAAAGGYVTKETTREYRDVHGKIVKETTRDLAAPEWRAAGWLLERGELGRQFFSKEALQRVELTGANGGPIEIGVDADNLAARVQANMQAALTAATAAIEPPDDDDVQDAEIIEQ